MFALRGDTHGKKRHPLVQIGINFESAAKVESLMRINVTECEILSLDSGVVDCSATGGTVPVLFVTIRVMGQGKPVNLAIRNPHRLAGDLPQVIERSALLKGGKFMSEHPEGDTK